jgi:arabinogalactan endo-1,4-beta-galactosidase
MIDYKYSTHYTDPSKIDTPATLGASGTQETSDNWYYVNLELFC